MLSLDKLDLGLSFQVDLVNLFTLFNQALFEPETNLFTAFPNFLQKIILKPICPTYEPDTVQVSVLRGLPRRRLFPLQRSLVIAPTEGVLPCSKFQPRKFGARLLIQKCDCLPIFPFRQKTPASSISRVWPAI